MCLYRGKELHEHLNKKTLYYDPITKCTISYSIISIFGNRQVGGPQCTYWLFPATVTGYVLGGLVPSTDCTTLIH